MADKRISQLIERVDIANNDVLPIVASGATTTNKVTISTIQDWMQENLDVGVTSVGITIGSTGTDVNVTGSPITTSGNITINIPTASATNRGLLSSADWNTFTNHRVPYTGATGNVNLGEYGISTGYVGLDTTPTGTPASQGTIYWDDSRSTAALIMNGTTQHIGQDSFFYVKNSTGSTIPKGTGVGFAGTDGASGHLLIQPFLANGSQPSTYFMGVTAEAITNGSFGQVMQFGELSGVNTSGYTAGALLYASTSVAGAFQTTAPQAPNNIILVAAAVNSTNNGSIIVRPQIGSNINNDEGVKITSVADKDLLQYQSGTGLWENKTRENAGVVTTDTSQTITATKQFTQGLSLGSAGGTNQLTVVKNIGTLHEGSASVNQIGFNSGNNIYFGKGLNNGGVISWNNAAVRYYTLPDADGTLALTSQIPANIVTGTGAAGRVAYWNGTGTITSDSLFQWNDTFKRLGIGRTPTVSLDVQGSQNISGTITAESTAGSGLRIYAGSGTNQWDMYLNSTNLRFSDNTGTGSVVFDRPLNGTSATFTGGTYSTINSIDNVKIGSSSSTWSGIHFTDVTTTDGFLGYNKTSKSFAFAIDGTNQLFTLASTGAATFSSSIDMGLNRLFTGGGFKMHYRNSTVNITYSGTSNWQVNNDADNAVLMSVLNGGNVGIGTASPSASEWNASATLLHLYQNSTNGSLLKLESSNASGIVGVGNNAMQLGSTSDDPVIFYTNVAERMRLTSDAYLRMASGSGGIQFNGDTAAANALDDYEEGTWTPEISFNTGTTGITYSVRQGSYTKIGNQVHVSGFILLTNKGTSTGTAFINNLPFTCLNSNGAYSAVSFRYGGITTSGTLIGISEINTTKIEMTEVNTSGVITAVTNSDFSNDASIIFSLTYKS